MKLLGHSNDHDTSSWAKFQIKIRPFDFSMNVLSEMNIKRNGHKSAAPSYEQEAFLGFA
jgi:hypothetical protein